MFGPIFCPDACCGGSSGLYDFYCRVFSGIEASGVLDRQASVEPIGAGSTGVWSTLDESPPWSVDYPESQIGVPMSSVAPMVDSELVWVRRGANEEHPDFIWSAELLTDPYNFDGWTFGGDPDVEFDEQELRSIVAAAADPWIKVSVSLTPSEVYRMSLIARQQDTPTVTSVTVKVTNIDTATDATMTIDLALETGGSSQFDMGDGSKEYVATFTAGASPGPSEFIIELAGAPDAGEGIVLEAASLRSMTGGGGSGADVAKFAPIAATCDVFVYPRTYNKIDWNNNRSPTHRFEETTWVSAFVSRYAAFAPEPDDQPIIDRDFYPGNGTLALHWVNSSVAAVMGLAPGDASNAYHPDVISVLGGSDSDRRNWGVSGLHQPAEYPPWDESEASGSFPSCIIFPASVPNSGEQLDRIVGASPHAYPLVWGYTPPRIIYYDAPACGWDEEPGSGYMSQFDKRLVNQEVKITLGPWQRKTVDVRVQTNPIVSATLPFLTGSDAVFWSESFEQERLVAWPSDIESHRLFAQPPLNGDHISASLLMDEVYDPEGAQTGAAIITWRKLTATISGTTPYYDWENLPDPEPGRPSESFTSIERRLVVKIGGSVVFDEEVWRDSQVPHDGNRDGPELWVTGLCALKPNEAGVAFVWFEAIWDVEPTSSVEGVRRGWKMHVCNTSGADMWTMDSLDHTPSGNSAAQCYAATERHFYVAGFPLCDSRVDADGEVVHGWTFSHGGTTNAPYHYWPHRLVVDNIDDSPYNFPVGDTLPQFDSIKNSHLWDEAAITPGVPALAQWPNPCCCTTDGPTADLDYTPTGLSVEFLDVSIEGCGGAIVTRQWEWDDGDPDGSGENPTHVYAMAGSYDVTLTVTDTAGCIDAVVIPVTVA